MGIVNTKHFGAHVFSLFTVCIDDLININVQRFSVHSCRAVVLS